MERMHMTRIKKENFEIIDGSRNNEDDEISADMVHCNFARISIKDGFKSCEFIHRSCRLLSMGFNQVSPSNVGCQQQIFCYFH